LRTFKENYHKEVQALDHKKFCENFEAAIQVQIPDSKYTSDAFLWTERELRCVRELAKKIWLCERNAKDNSCVFVGMKGVGKTTLYVNSFMNIQ
jgi:hypothetical protein